MSHEKKVDFSTHDLGSRVCEFLTRVHPSKTAQHVASNTGIPAASIAYWLATRGRPSASHLLALIAAYEAEFLIAIAPGLSRWLDPVRRERKLIELQRKRDLITNEIQALRDETDEMERRMDSHLLVDGGRAGVPRLAAGRRRDRLPESRAIDREADQAAGGEFAGENWET